MPNVFMKCATSLRYARLVRALFRLASHTSSSGIAANASTLTRTGDVCLDTTTAVVFFSLARFPAALDTTVFFVALFFLLFFAIFGLYIVRYNRVYHVLHYHEFVAVKSQVMHSRLDTAPKNKTLSPVVRGEKL